MNVIKAESSLQPTESHLSLQGVLSGDCLGVFDVALWDELAPHNSHQCQTSLKANAVFYIKNMKCVCLICSFFNKLKLFFYLTRFIKPVTEPRVLEGDFTSTGLFTSTTQRQGQSWTSPHHHWHPRSSCRTPDLFLQIPCQPFTSAGDSELMSI